ncbi:TetR/AcrR family transcriptional regulator [Catenuloplanes japonicus]|uniref:TetR/AcrR family transcriptional regulator n=1 Tax=Catenuloplanes japonicus TaxID=33876 RepID=UPI00068E29F6|nr:TetR/AcrR family transcriptional regulator [Catenuloplanes japonicus]
MADKRDSRTALLAAAAEEFALHGRRGTRIQAITAAAGVNERMIYHHFGSKDGLYTAVIQEQQRALAAEWLPVMEKAAELPPYEGLRAILLGYFQIVRLRPVFVRLMVHEALAPEPAVPPASPAELPETARLLWERGQAEGVFRADQPFELAYGTAMSAIMARVVFAARDAEVARVMALPDEAVIDLLLDGLTGP